MHSLLSGLVFVLCLSVAALRPRVAGSARKTDEASLAIIAPLARQSDMSAAALMLRAQAAAASKAAAIEGLLEVQMILVRSLLADVSALAVTHVHVQQTGITVQLHAQGLSSRFVTPIEATIGALIAFSAKQQGGGQRISALH
jgi:hypothetical protein